MPCEIGLDGCAAAAAATSAASAPETIVFRTEPPTESTLRNVVRTFRSAPRACTTCDFATCSKQPKRSARAARSYNSEGEGKADFDWGTKGYGRLTKNTAEPAVKSSRCARNDRAACFEEQILELLLAADRSGGGRKIFDDRAVRVANRETERAAALYCRNLPPDHIGPGHEEIEHWPVKWQD